MIRHPPVSHPFPNTPPSQSFVPSGSIVPRRFRCQPELEVETEIARVERSTGAELDAAARAAIRARIEPWLVPRSEEHTSELQSRQYLVCRLLLEKKKQK